MLLFVETITIFQSKIKINGKRDVANILSLGSINSVSLDIENDSPYQLSLSVLDELPEQLQERNFNFKLELSSGEKKKIAYEIKPLSRGEYHFGKIHVFVKMKIGLVIRRISIASEQTIPVFPSVMEMKKYELKAVTRVSNFLGIKKVRKIGHGYEFEQIKSYVKGDDYRSINWKATGSKRELMVNQFEDEKSQQIYCVIDKGRAMKMAFNGLSLMDYAINSSLVISNVALKKQDKSGLITFSDKMGTLIRAEKKFTQLKGILNALYREKERNFESNYEMLYIALKKIISGRSLIFLFANFENLNAAKRIMPVLSKINRQHLLITIFFENSEISDFSKRSASTIEDIYNQTIAEKYVTEKHQIVNELNRIGLQTILCRPEHLSISTLNKYLELKARGMI